MVVFFHFLLPSLLSSNPLPVAGALLDTTSFLEERFLPQRAALLHDGFLRVSVDLDRFEWTRARVREGNVSAAACRIFIQSNVATASSRERASRASMSGFDMMIGSYALSAVFAARDHDVSMPPLLCDRLLYCISR